MQYKKYICEAVNKITAEKTLKRIYKFVMYLWAREEELDAGDRKELQSCR